LQDLGAKIDTILEGIPVVKEENKDKVQSEELENKVSDLESKLEEKDAENEKLSEQVNDLNVSLDESVDLAKKFGIRAYTEEKLNGHSDRVRLRNIIDKANVDTTEQVDALVDSYTINTSDGAQMVEKIKEHVGHQAETISESNGTEPNGKMSNGEVLGSSFSELRELAGLNNPQSSKKEIN
jgi:predicted RNase H-like nuclease (RuvC/YqgF family)